MQTKMAPTRLAITSESGYRQRRRDPDQEVPPLCAIRAVPEAASVGGGLGSYNHLGLVRLITVGSRSAGWSSLGAYSWSRSGARGNHR